MEINIIMKPEILLSKEIISNKCVYDRVLKHEKLHHGFAIQSATKLMVQARVIADKYVAENYIGYNQAQVDKEIDSKRAKMVEEIKYLFIKDYEALNKTIDNEENYKKEAKICPEYERNQFNRLIISNK